MGVGSFDRFVRASCAGMALCIYLCGCQAIDFATVEPRSYQVNLGTQNLREELILLNVVRASRFEPLNFTALSKYTASGQLGASASALKNIGIDYVLFKGGPATGANIGSSPLNTVNAGGNVSTGNSFDLIPLDNSDFYANFLAPLTPEKINLLVNAGLSREVVFLSLIKAIDINLSPAGQKLAKGYGRLRYSNNPSNDTWLNNSSRAAFEQCERAAMEDENRPDGRRWAPFMSNFWYGEHLNDCHYHKFLLLVKQAFEYGVTTATLLKTSPASASPQKAESVRVDQKTINITVNQNSAQKSGSLQEVILCFDPALAANFQKRITTSLCPSGTRMPGGAAKSKTQGGATETLLTQPLQTQLGPYDESMEPVLRSAYGVFQYYGELLRTGTLVPISPYSQRNTADQILFNVMSNGTGCFVGVSYSAVNYCVSNEGANNTKEVLQLLIALVNLSTVRSSLPVTSSVITNPN